MLKESRENHQKHCDIKELQKKVAQLQEELRQTKEQLGKYERDGQEGGAHIEVGGEGGAHGRRGTWCSWWYLRRRRWR